MREFNEWLASNYNLKYRRDPVPRWKERAKKLRAESNPHAALRNYHNFMTETVSIREALMESAAACGAEIDAAIQRARGN